MDDFTLGKMLLGNEKTFEQQAAAANPATASIIEMIAVTSSSGGEVVVKAADEDPEDVWEAGEPGVDFIELDEDGDFEEEAYDNVDDIEAPEEIALDTTDGDGADIEEPTIEAAAFTVERYHDEAVAAAAEEAEQEDDPVPGEDATITDELDDGDAEDVENPGDPSLDDDVPDENAAIDEIADDDYALLEDDDPDESEEPLEGAELSDGSTIVETTVSVKAGDRVMVSVQDGHMTVIGVVGGGDEEHAERILLGQAQQEVAKEAEEAKAAAEAVVGKADEALAAANTANANAKAAQSAAVTAKTKAESASAAANEAKGSVSAITADLNTVKTDASQTLGAAIDSLAEKKVETMAAGYATSDDLKAQEVELKSEIERSAGKIQTTMQAEYARKTDLTESTMELQSQITQTAGKISASVSNIADAMANLQSDEVKAAIQAAKASLEAAAIDLDDAKNALVVAQINAINATANASTAQNLASDANAALSVAQKELAEAQAYRDKLIQLGGTTEEIEEAEQAVAAARISVTTAQNAANEATANAEAASRAAEEALAAVTTAESNVATAQDAYDLAVNGLHEASYSGIEQTADAITSRVTKTEVKEAIDEVEVGGRNYFSNKKESAFNEDNEFELPVYNGVVGVGSFVQFKNLTKPMSFFVGKEAMLSFECISPNGESEFSVYNRNANPRYLITATGVIAYVGAEWTRQEVKISVADRGEGYDEESSNKLEFYFRDQPGGKVRNVKFEVGNKATDWTPAPEDQEAYTDAAAGAVQNSVDDMGERVTASESVIQQLADSVSSIVRSGDETSLVKQDESGLFYFDIEALQSSADESAKNLADLLKAIGDIDADDEETLLGKLSKLESELTAIGLKTEYVTVSTYDGEPCIILGETDSVFKLLITNTRIVFLEGSTETTYIKDNTLVTNNVEVKNEIKQGSWAWKARPNGNLGLVWIGGDN